MTTLRNGVPINVQSGCYELMFKLLPQRIGDETLIWDPVLGERRVILLRGIGRRKYLVDCTELRRYLRAESRAKIAALPRSA